MTMWTYNEFCNALCCYISVLSRIYIHTPVDTYRCVETLDSNSQLLHYDPLRTRYDLKQCSAWNTSNVSQFSDWTKKKKTLPVKSPTPALFDDDTSEDRNGRGVMLLRSLWARGCVAVFVLYKYFVIIIAVHRCKWGLDGGLTERHAIVTEKEDFHRIDVVNYSNTWHPPCTTGSRLLSFLWEMVLLFEKMPFICKQQQIASEFHSNSRKVWARGAGGGAREGGHQSHDIWNSTWSSFFIVLE